MINISFCSLSMNHLWSFVTKIREGRSWKIIFNFSWKTKSDRYFGTNFLFSLKLQLDLNGGSRNLLVLSQVRLFNCRYELIAGKSTTRNQWAVLPHQAEQGQLSHIVSNKYEIMIITTIFAFLSFHQTCENPLLPSELSMLKQHELWMLLPIQELASCASFGGKKP